MKKRIILIKYFAPIILVTFNSYFIFTLVMKGIAPLNAPILLGVIGVILFYPIAINSLINRIQLPTHNTRLNHNIALTTLIGAIGVFIWMSMALVDYGIHKEIFIISFILIIQMLALSIVNWRLTN